MHREQPLILEILTDTISLYDTPPLLGGTRIATRPLPPATFEIADGRLYNTTAFTDVLTSLRHIMRNPTRPLTLVVPALARTPAHLIAGVVLQIALATARADLLIDRMMSTYDDSTDLLLLITTPPTPRLHTWFTATGISIASLFCLIAICTYLRLDTARTLVIKNTALSAACTHLEQQISTQSLPAGSQGHPLTVLHAAVTSLARTLGEDDWIEHIQSSPTTQDRSVHITGCCRDVTTATRLQAHLQEKERWPKAKLLTISKQKEIPAAEGQRFHFSLLGSLPTTQPS